VKNFNFPKTIKRKLFNVIFGGVGRRRFIQDYFNTPKPVKARFKMQKTRRAHQGWRNRVYGSITMRKIRRVFGQLRKPLPPFRR